MHEFLVKFILTVLPVILFNFLNAQESERAHIEMARINRLEIDRISIDTIAVVHNRGFEDIKDTVTVSDILVPDDKYLNDIFGEKLDNMENSWYIKNLFSSPGDSAGPFPANLPDTVYINRLRSIEQIVHMSYNKVIKNFIRLYTEKRREQVEIMLGLSAFYFPIFEEILDKNDLPLELKYLPVIESALNPRARSRAGANGLWQFMYRTAKQMNLEITSFVDERMDPVRSTEAAVRYLKQLYDTYDDWHLTIAAYNCGPGNVNRAIRRAGNKNNYWEIYYLLPRETRGYVPAFIAASYVMNYYKDHNLVPRFPAIPLGTDTLMVNDHLHFNQIAATLNIDKEQVRSLNPMYRHDVIPAKKEKPYPVILPVSKIMEFIDRDTVVYAFDREKYFPDNSLVDPTSSTASYFTPADVEGKAKILYTVKSGDNVGFISSWFDVRASDLRYWNNIHRNLIRVGQKLAIYVDKDQEEKYEKVNSMSFAQKQAMIGKPVNITKPEPQPLDPGYEYYTVKRGDTLWDIARKYAGISPEEILKLNDLYHGSKLSIGQKLKIKLKGS